MYTADAYLIFSLIISLGGGVIVSRWLYVYPRSNQGRLKFKLLFVMRALVVGLVFLFLLNPVVQRRSVSLQKPTLDLLIDNSKSILHVADSLHLEAFSNLHEELQQSLSEKFDVRTSLFDDGITLNDSKQHGGLVTNIAKALIKLDRDEHSAVAAVLVSDGNYNQGENPVFISRQLSFPVFSVIVGDTLPKAKVHIHNIIHNPVGYENEKNPVEIELRYQGVATDTTITIKMIDGDDVVIDKPVQLEANKRRKKIAIYLEPDAAGVKKYRVYVKGNESQQRFFYMDIKKQKQKVLILYHAVHPDIGAIQRALVSSNRFEPILHQASSFDGNFDEFSVVIFHQLPSGDFFEDKYFADVLERKIPYWVILGASTDYSLFNQGQSLLRLTNLNGEFEEAGMLLLPDFSWFRLSSAGNADFSKFPPLTVPFADYSSVKGKTLFSQSLYGVETNRVAWVFADMPFRSSVLAGTGLWRWRIDEYRKSGSTVVVDDLIYKVVRFLSVDEPQKRLAVDYEKIYTPAQPIRFDAVWYNENYERDNSIEGKLHVFDSANIRYSFKFWPKNDAYVADLGSLQPGKYKFSSVFTSGEQSFADSGRFVVSHLNIEAYSSEANAQVMRGISGAARFFTLNKKDQLIESLLNNESFQSVRKVTLLFDDIINQYFLLFAVLLLLFVEWFVRKYSGI